MADVEAALAAHEAGYFGASGRLLDALLIDEYVASLIALRVGTVSGLPEYFELPTAPGEAVQVRGLREDWERIFPVEERDAVLYQTLMMGFCLAYDARLDPQDLPRWKAWPAYAVRYNTTTDLYEVETRWGGWQAVTPGDGRWALFALRSSYPWLAGYIRSVAPMMVIRQSQLYNGANHAQVYATPSRVLTCKPEVAETKDVRRALEALSKLVGDSTINLLEGMKLDLLELKEVTYEIYLKLREAIDVSLAVLLVGQAGTTKAAGGWGSAHTERRVTQQLLERDVRVQVPTAHQQIMAPYDRWKRGTLDILRVPRWVPDTTPPQDLDAMARRKLTEAQANEAQARELNYLSKLRWPADGPGDEEWRVDMSEVCKQRGLQVLRGPRPPAPARSMGAPAPQEAAA